MYKQKANTFICPSKRKLVKIMAKIERISVYKSIDLHNGWEFTGINAGATLEPNQLKVLDLEWFAARVPGTVVSALQAINKWDVFQFKNLDSKDWWYRCRFDCTLPQEGVQVILMLGGLASIADVWLNDSPILFSNNMFLEHEIDVTQIIAEKNELYIRFQSLQTCLEEKRPRPRWKTRLVNDQQLRWFRTTLIGRMPGWTPPIQAIGPWRSIVLEERSFLTVEELNIKPLLVGSDGMVNATIRLRLFGSLSISEAFLEISDNIVKLDLYKEKDGTIVACGELRIPNLSLWWPHTHGPQNLYSVKVLLLIDETPIEVYSNRIGFRTIDLPAVKGEDVTDFKFSINGHDVFCRGACWTTLDVNTLSGSPDSYLMALTRVRDAGMNMLRLSGTMVYELDHFYNLCDELGIMVWQDFMFANMDYPIDNNDFMTNVKNEAEQTLNRLQTHPCITIFCGNNEIEQQASMLGLPQELWSNSLFSSVLPQLCEQFCPFIPYWPSSPSGGVLPFQPNKGNSHYQGVGAFMQPLEDARRAQVRFASECLTFANIPEDRTIDLFIRPGELAITHPKWKLRTARDNGVGWDFEDIRDYYLQKLFQEDPLRLRYSNMERYLALSRITPGEVMAEVFADWRRKESTCKGGLVWFYQDFWPGAGWGIVDSTGYPKAAYYYLKRVFSSVAIFFSDERLNGLLLHAMNETSDEINARLRLAIYRYTGALVAESIKDVTLAPREGFEISVDALFDGFRDLTYAFRFGPPGYDLIVATLINKLDGSLISDTFYFPMGRPSFQENDIGLEAVAKPRKDGSYTLTLTSKKFAQTVAIKTADFFPENNYFHIEPGGERNVIVRSPFDKDQLKGTVQPLNTFSPTRIVIENE